MTVTPEPSPTTPAPKKTNPLLIALAVAVVAIPLAWGVSQTVMKSKPLFHAAKSTTTKPAKAPKGDKSVATTATTGPTTHDAKPGNKHKKK